MRHAIIGLQSCNRNGILPRLDEVTAKVFFWIRRNGCEMACFQGAAIDLPGWHCRCLAEEA
jgi:hypothetical protein